MIKSVFITGTDTGVGKTYVTVQLLKQFNARGYKTFAMKPIASGCHHHPEIGLVNDDALLLQKNASLFRPYQVVNPIALQEPIAPHLAALNITTLSVAKIAKQIQNSIQSEADINMIEGAGGWALPLNDHELYCDVVRVLNIPVILVVSIKLGCINHTILTARSIQQMNVPLIGWVANCFEPNVKKRALNIATLRQWLPFPCMGILSHHNQNNSLKIELMIQN